MKTPEEIFEYCWQEIEAGHKTVEACVRLFPDTPELAERLQNASRLRGLRALTLRPEASRRIESQITARFKQRQRRPKSSGTLMPQLGWASVVTVFLVTILGFVAWVPRSVPGEIPYSIKRSVEDVQINLTSPEERGEVYADLAQQRVQEIEVLVARPDVSPARLAAALAEASEYTELSLSFVMRLSPTRRAEVLRQLLSNLERHTTLIATVEASAPTELAPQISQAAEAAAESQVLASTYYEATTGSTFTPGAATTDAPAVSATPLATLASESTPTPLSATATNAPTHTTQPTKTASAVPPTATSVPPTNTVQPTKTASPVPPTATPVPPSNTPKPTKTASPIPPSLTPSITPPGQSDCVANNPNSPRYCTPTPQP